MPVLLLSLLLLSATGLVLWIVRPHRFRFSGWLAAIPPALVTALQLNQLVPVSQGLFLNEIYPWAPSLWLEVNLWLDGLSLLFGLIVTGIGTAVALYTAYYFEDDDRQGYFYLLLFLFMTSMLGLVWSNNLLTLFVFWEGTSITSYLLIAFKTQDKASLEGGRTAFVVTSFGGLAMLAGFIIIGAETGTLVIADLNSMDLTSSPLYPIVLVLILLGAFTKSAQFPFHFWLPGAMAAPTPASAYLHSATMVKAGVFLLARLHPAMSESPLWFWALLITGGITMLLGAVSAIRYYDMKALLAYATVSQLGVLVMLLAFQGEEAYIAVAVGILAHALYKGPLFMVAGIVDHATGTRDLRRLANLARPLLWVTVTATLAGISLAGIPPSFGFLAKETLLETLYHFMEHVDQAVGAVLLVAALIVGAFFVAASFTLLWEIFYRKQADSDDQAHVHHKPAFSFVFGPLVLTLIGAAVPLTLGLVEGVLFAPAATAIGHEPVHPHLSLWHGLTPTFLLSLVAIVAGIGLFYARNWLRRVLNAAPDKLSGSYVFDQIDKGTYAVADWSTKTVQGGTLATQASVVLLAGIAVLIVAIVQWDLLPVVKYGDGTISTVYVGLTVILIIFAALATARAQRRLTGIISIGVVGIGITLFFVFFSAPDLALTQLLIEVLTVVLLILVFYRIPPETRPDMGLRGNIRNWTMAILVGVFGFTLALLASGGAFAPSISDYFLLNSIAGGHGANVVNVILVDFRGYDTLGEITVLAIAALGGYALLRSPRFQPLRQEQVALQTEDESDGPATSADGQAADESESNAQ